MKAIHMTAVGEADVLEPVDIAEPELTSSTQVKVRLHAAGVNPIDTKVRSRGLFYNAECPAVLGCDGAGEIVAIGDKVGRFQIGDLVWFCHGGLGREQGNYAQFTVIEQNELELKPKNFGFNEAAAAPLVLITAWEALFDQAGLSHGQSILIHAGAGGVGHVAIQLARNAGARVIATVGNEENAEFVRDLGADEVINYREDNLLERVMEITDNKGVDVSFDTVGHEAFVASIPATAHYGTLVTLLDPGSVEFAEARARNLKIAFTLMLTPMLHDLSQPRAHHGEILRTCGQWIDDGHLQIHISQTLALEEAAEAHQAIATGHTRGKIVLRID